MLIFVDKYWVLLGPRKQRKMTLTNFVLLHFTSFHFIFSKGFYYDFVLPFLSAMTSFTREINFTDSAFSFLRQLLN